MWMSMVDDQTKEVVFCLADVCKVLELHANVVKQRLDKGVCSTYTLPTNGGPQKMLFINEDGLYDVILDSRKPEAKAFRKWVTSVVLPQIRKTGGYIPVRKEDDEKTILSRALLICQHTLEQKDKLIEEQKPLVQFAKALNGSEGSIHLSEMAKGQQYFLGLSRLLSTTCLEGSTLTDLVLASSQICVVEALYPETSSPVTHRPSGCKAFQAYPH